MTIFQDKMLTRSDCDEARHYAVPNASSPGTLSSDLTSTILNNQIFDKSQELQAYSNKRVTRLKKPPCVNQRSWVRSRASPVFRMILLNRGPMTIFQDKMLTRSDCDEARHYAVPNASSPGTLSSDLTSTRLNNQIFDKSQELQAYSKRRGL